MSLCSWGGWVVARHCSPKNTREGASTLRGGERGEGGGNNDKGEGENDNKGERNNHDHHHNSTPNHCSKQLLTGWKQGAAGGNDKRRGRGTMTMRGMM